MTILLRLALTGLAAYLCFCAALFLMQRRMIYPVPPGQPQPHYPPCRLVTFHGSDDSSYMGMYAAAPEGARTVVAFHGNAEDLSHQDVLAAAVTGAGLGFLAVEYPGYGMLSGPQPTEASNYAAAAAALRWLREQGIGPDRTVLFGQSLGTGIAMEMASHQFADRVILVSPFTSMVRMAKKTAPIAPVGLLLRDRYNSLAKAPKVTQPVLVVHGTEDEIVPYEQGAELCAALPNGTLVTLDGMHHNDLPLADGYPLMAQVLRFAKQ